MNRILTRFWQRYETRVSLSEDIFIFILAYVFYVFLFLSGFPILKFTVNELDTNPKAIVYKLCKWCTKYFVFIIIHAEINCRLSKGSLMQYLCRLNTCKRQMSWWMNIAHHYYIPKALLGAKCIQPESYGSIVSNNPFLISACYAINVKG